MTKWLQNCAPQWDTLAKHFLNSSFKGFACCVFFHHGDYNEFILLNKELFGGSDFLKFSEHMAADFSVVICSNTQEAVDMCDASETQHHAGFAPYCWVWDGYQVVHENT